MQAATARLASRHSVHGERQRGFTKEKQHGVIQMTEFDSYCQSMHLDSMATTMNISLPEALREFVEEAVRAGGYSSVSEYVRELVRQAKAERELEGRLMAALESADLGEVGPELFDDLKARAKKAVRRRK